VLRFVEQMLSGDDYLASLVHNFTVVSLLMVVASLRYLIESNRAMLIYKLIIINTLIPYVALYSCVSFTDKTLELYVRFFYRI